MKIRNLTLHNFRAFEDISIDFSEHTMAIIGNNGVGKTTLLDAIAIWLSHITGNLISETVGYNINAGFSDSDITNGKKQGCRKVAVN